MVYAKRGGFMGHRNRLGLMIGLVVICVLGGLLGCGGGKTAGAKAKSPVFAEQYLAAIYGGSMAPVKDSLAPAYVKIFSDGILAPTTKLLSENYGAVKKVEFDSQEKVQRVWTATVWRVTAEKGSYQMKIVTNRKKQTEDILLQLSPGEKWVSIYTIGEDAMIARMKQKAEKGAGK
jgi:hypothetical protein